MLNNVNTEPEIIAYIKRKLGDCRVGVELTDDQIKDAMFDAMEELSRWLPIRKLTVKTINPFIEVQPSQVLGAPGGNIYSEYITVEVKEYTDPNSGFRGIMDVVPDSDDSTSLLTKRGVGFGFPVPLNFMYNVENVYNIQFWQYENLLMWIETLKNTFATQFEWEYKEGFLYLWYVPNTATRVMYVWTKHITKLEEIDVKYRKWFLDYAYQSAKLVLAEIRGKITSGIPAPAGAMTLNADILRSEAIDQMEKLKEDLMLRAGSEPAIWGT